MENICQTYFTDVTNTLTPHPSPKMRYRVYTSHKTYSSQQLIAP